MIDLVKAALRGGFKTSEFWLAVLALLTPYLDGLFTHIYNAITNAQHAATNPLLVIVLAGAAAFVSAAYSIGRSLIKKESIQQAPTITALGSYLTPSGNIATVPATDQPRGPVTYPVNPPTP